jgi:hypothetical protein
VARERGVSAAEIYGITDELRGFAFDLAVKTHLYVFEATARRKGLIFQAQLIATALLTGELPTADGAE